jgi:hypothetical protein
LEVKALVDEIVYQGLETTSEASDDDDNDDDDNDDDDDDEDDNNDNNDDDNNDTEAFYEFFGAFNGVAAMEDSPADKGAGGTPSMSQDDGSGSKRLGSDIIEGEDGDEVENVVGGEVGMIDDDSDDSLLLKAVRVPPQRGRYRRRSHLESP